MPSFRNRVIARVEMFHDALDEGMKAIRKTGGDPENVDLFNSKRNKLLLDCANIAQGAKEHLGFKCVGSKDGGSKARRAVEQVQARAEGIVAFANSLPTSLPKEDFEHAWHKYYGPNPALTRPAKLAVGPAQQLPKPNKRTRVPAGQRALVRFKHADRLAAERAELAAQARRRAEAVEKAKREAEKAAEAERKALTAAKKAEQDAKKAARPSTKAPPKIPSPKAAKAK